MGVRVRKASGVIPHFPGVGDLATEGVGHPMVHAAIRIGMGTVQHLGRLWPVTGPVGAAFGMAAINTTGSQNDGRRRQADVFTGRFIDGQGAAHFAGFVVERSDSVLVQQGELAGDVFPKPHGSGVDGCHHRSDHAPPSSQPAGI